MKRIFGSWEMNDDQVTHLHLVFEHQGRVDTVRCKHKLQQIPFFSDATISTIKLERKRSFPNFARFAFGDIWNTLTLLFTGVVPVYDYITLCPLLLKRFGHMLLFTSLHIASLSTFRTWHMSTCDFARVRSFCW